jgi:hypothetical protein
VLLTNRRRYQRFVVSDPWKGTLRAGQDVAVERWDGGLLTVTAPGMDGRFFSMRVEWSEAGTQRSIGVRPAAVEPVVVENTVWCRMRLAFEGPEGDDDRKALASLADKPPESARLVREVPVEICDFSQGGVLMDTTTPVEVGAVGWLAIANPDGEFWSDYVRICRTLTLRRSGFICRAGAEFLPQREFDGRSLRAAFQRLESKYGFRIPQTVQGGQHVAVARSVRS